MAFFLNLLQLYIEVKVKIFCILWGKSVLYNLNDLTDLFQLNIEHKLITEIKNYKKLQL